ncbi:TPA: Ni/Fe hydrogenase subunit alpha [Methanopyrus kandleri]|uniref:Ni/Fe hydrogenase subunit alpha n=1 Tax=Methanopyrus kandleri TaxID=2320 RepID=A0A832SU28_9EURY|nr:Ni/Fe hydrogenase subunit alpha [Methanopyrus kandleri]
MTMEIEAIRVATGAPGELYMVAEIAEDKVVNAEVCSGTTPISWETLVLEKPVEFAVVAAERVCASCDASLGLAVVEAAEAALNVEIPDEAERAREILNMANVVRAHATVLARTDFLDVKKPAYDLVRAAKDIMHAVGGKPDHPPAVTVGGLDLEKLPVDRVESVAKDAAEVADRLEDEVGSAVDRMKEDIDVEPEEMPAGLKVSDTYKGDIDPDKVETLMPDEFYRMKTTLEIANNVVARYDGEPVLVGPYARVRSAENPLDLYTARAEEVARMLDGIANAVSRLDPTGNFRTDVELGSGEGTAAVEAPEGTLIVSLRLRAGRVDKALMLTPCNFKVAAIGEMVRDLTVDRAETVLRAIGLSGRCLTH